jgi:hypothetical protein
MVPARGFEPRTLGLKGRCSDQLSYTGVGPILRPARAPSRCPAGAQVTSAGHVYPAGSTSLDS